MKTWNFLWISDLISRLKYEAVSPWDHIHYTVSPPYYSEPQDVYLQSGRGPPIVADTAIQFLKHKLSGRGGVTDELLELLEECYLKRSSENLISGLRLLSREPTAVSQLEFWSFSRIYTAACSNRGNLPLSLMVVHHILLPWISPQISLASWLNPLAFPVVAAGKPAPRRRGHHQTRWSLGKSCPSHLHGSGESVQCYRTLPDQTSH